MTLTKAQRELLVDLENGSEITFKDDYYVVFSRLGGYKIWPSTFYGLFDQKMVEKTVDGTYTISDYGREQIK